MIIQRMVMNIEQNHNKWYVLIISTIATDTFYLLDAFCEVIFPEYN